MKQDEDNAVEKTAVNSYNQTKEDSGKKSQREADFACEEVAFAREEVDIAREEARLQKRLAQIEQLEHEVKTREDAIKEKEKSKKQILLRLAPSLWNEISKWAEDDFRSINSQIEYLLTEAVKERHSSK